MAKLNLGGKGTKEEKKAPETINIISCEIDRAVNNDYGVFFDMTINGVKINGCNLALNKDGEPFIGLPSKKGKDGKYYSVCYIRFSGDDTQKIIEMIEQKLG